MANETENSLGFAKGDLGQLRITFGDRSADGKADVSVAVYGRLPFQSGDPKKMLDLGPFNLPTEQILTGAQLAAGALPKPAGHVISVVIAIVKTMIS